ncbi:MAG: elongator complex protein 3 [Acutalibacteraceae bacterium]
MKHVNVALFVPDEGCVHRCSFCNQKTISGKTEKPTADDVKKAAETALQSQYDCHGGEIAFFGGSFTAIEREYMLSLLEAAKPYIESKSFKGIRISTRPDCIDEEILSLLRSYGVTAIEIGCQSMSDRVLSLNDRGHTSKDIENAAHLIKAFGFELGVQMMTGLYADDDETAIETAKKLIALGPDTARIYPTVVLKGTRLCELYEAGEYRPQTLHEAVSLCSKLLRLFNESGIPVIRLGLHSGGNVEEGYVAGAYHPAFRQLVNSRLYLNAIKSELEKQGIEKGEITVSVSPKYISDLVGQKRCNITELEKNGLIVRIKADESLQQYQIKLQGNTR